MVPAVTSQEQRPFLPTLPIELACGALLLLVPFWSYLHLHAYPILRPDSLIIAAILAVLGGAYGWLVCRAKSAVVRTVLLALLMLVSADLFADVDGMHAPLLLLFAGIAWLLRTHVMKLVVVTLVAYLVITLAVGTRVRDQSLRATASSTAMDGPPIVHLIADEHIGIEGIPLDVPGAQAIKDSLVQFYVARGFRLFTRAYSRYYQTINVAPNEFNFARSTKVYGWVNIQSRPRDLEYNRYFERLKHAGYETHVFQPDYINFCAARAAPPLTCYTAPTNAMLHLPLLQLDVLSAVRLVAAYWITNRSSLFDSAVGKYESRLRPLLAMMGLPAPHLEVPFLELVQATGLAVLNRLREDLSSAPSLRGNAYFAHSLLPHKPYLVDAECTGLRPLGPSLASENEGDRLAPDEFRRRYASYLPGLACVTLQVDSVLATLATKGASDAIVIVQGDHGARVGENPSLTDPPSREIFADYYSAFFAIRAPGIAPGVDTMAISLTRLLDGLSSKQFRTLDVEPDAHPYVFVGEAARPLRQLEEMPVPSSWFNPPERMP